MNSPDENRPDDGKPDGRERHLPYPGHPGESQEFWQWLATLTDDDLLTMDEAAAMARMPVDTLRHTRKRKQSGKGPQGFRMGKRVMFRKGQVREWLKSLEASQNPNAA